MQANDSFNNCNYLVSILDNDTSPGDKRTLKDDIETREAPLPSISSEETISLVQSALGPEIERRMEARRQMDIVAMFVSEYLHLNVAWMHNILLNDHMVIIKAFHGLTLGRI